MCSSRKYPCSTHRRDWNFLGGGGFCKAKKFKEMYEALLELVNSGILFLSCSKCVTFAPASISHFTSSGGKQFCNDVYILLSIKCKFKFKFRISRGVGDL